MLPDGRFMTIWSDDGSADQGHIGSLNGQIFTDAGVADSAVLTFATSPRGFGRRHSVAMLPDGGLALSWDSDPAGFSVQIINADGTLSGLTQHFTTSTAGGGAYVQIAALVNGDLVVAWQEQSTSGGDLQLAPCMPNCWMATAKQSAHSFK